MYINRTKARYRRRGSELRDRRKEKKHHKQKKRERETIKSKYEIFI